MTIAKTPLQNAGLILVHPYLVRLYIYLNYLDDEQQIRDAPCKWRAVALLQYMATGNPSIDKASHIIMEKFLSGIAPETSVPQEVVLTQQEKEYGDEVLKVIIDNWEKLGKTSNVGLQNSFLQRDGILEEVHESYQLNISSTTFDILLDFIPWSINTIKLPWMKYIIYSSWR